MARHARAIRCGATGILRATGALVIALVGCGGTLGPAADEAAIADRPASSPSAPLDDRLLTNEEMARVEVVFQGNTTVPADVLREDVATQNLRTPAGLEQAR